MFPYAPQIALVVAFLMVIVLHAWFTRRMLSLRDRALAARAEYGKLRGEVVALAQEVGEFKQGLESNAVAIKALEAEIEEWQKKIAVFAPPEEEELF
jgi:cell division protein FtsB